ncbi:hypothetical protein AAEX37_01030 [Oligella sp. MSHR50489EDL]|uniref:phage portal protein n=1 Tax=Oligella sp. MSHR50489EDL TaxID=3139409 RepID=UPI003D8152AC
MSKVEFSIDDVESVMRRADILDYIQSYDMGSYYAPPLNWNALAKTLRSNAHHSSCIYVKKNVLSSTYIDNDILQRQSFEAAVLDYLIFGNCYFEKKYNRAGKLIALSHVPAKFARRGKKLSKYYLIKNSGDCHEFRDGDVLHLMNPDINQEIYGMPEYIAALQSALLNESATLFRRKYYLNGTHAGYIMYLTDPKIDEQDVEALRKAVQSSKGVGNFKNLFMYSPNGDRSGLQLIPLSEVAAKDEFLNIKDVTRDDILAAHRVPPHLMGIVPKVTGGFGSITDAAKVFNANEIEPLQSRFYELNRMLGTTVVEFGTYSLAAEAVE